jgi:hypothetical protein
MYKMEISKPRRYFTLCVTLLLLSAFGSAQRSNVLVSGAATADFPAVLYPGWGTTLDGKQLYYSVLLAAGFEIQTADAASKIDFGGAELDMAPYSTLVIGNPFVLRCGTIVIRSGAAEISDEKSTSSFKTGESAYSALPNCGDLLPDAPSAVRKDQNVPAARSFRHNVGTAPAMTGPGLYIDAKVANWSYWAVNGAMLSSSLVSANLAQKCFSAQACTFVPDALRSRKAMYGAGLPATVAVSYFSYYLKSKSYRLWFVPAALVIGGNVLISAHAAHYSQ